MNSLQKRKLHKAMGLIATAILVKAEEELIFINCLQFITSRLLAVFIFIQQTFYVPQTLVFYVFRYKFKRHLDSGKNNKNS